VAPAGFRTRGGGTLVALSETSYPRLAAYLRSLPHGIASYPECQAKASLCRTLLEAMPAPVPDVSHVPEPVRAIFTKPPRGMWMPEVEVMAFSLFIADHYAMTDDGFKRWLKKANRSLFRTIMFRALFALISPAALIPRGGVRWAAVHKGSELHGRIVGPTEAEVLIRFPPNLFVRSLLVHLAAVFEAALEHCNARSCEVALVHSDERRGCYRIFWS
jgi:hypothetical protein